MNMIFSAKRFFKNLSIAFCCLSWSLIFRILCVGGNCMSSIHCNSVELSSVPRELQERGGQQLSTELCLEAWCPSSPCTISELEPHWF